MQSRSQRIQKKVFAKSFCMRLLSFSILYITSYAFLYIKPFLLLLPQNLSKKEQFQCSTHFPSN